MIVQFTTSNILYVLFEQILFPFITKRKGKNMKPKEKFLLMIPFIFLTSLFYYCIFKERSTIISTDHQMTYRNGIYNVKIGWKWYKFTSNKQIFPNSTIEIKYDLFRIKSYRTKNYIEM